MADSVADPSAPDARTVAAAVRSGAADPVELVEAALARIEAVDRGGPRPVGAFVEVDADGARRAAARVRDAVRAGESLGPLAGVPVGVKDLFDVAGSVTRGGSDVPAGPPATTDSRAVDRLRAAGAVMLGRTRTHEFAWGLTTQHPWLGGTRNPHDPDRIPGGSSGGSGAAVAAGMVPLALGTDTGCSLRLPAAFCGLVAHKPTAGLVPLDGVLPLAPTMDSGGTLVRSVGDARLSVELLSRRPLAPPAPVNGLVVGLGLEGDVPPLSFSVAAAVRGAAGTLADLVADVVPVRVPLIERGPEIYRGIQAREARAWHTETGRWPRHAARYGDDVRGRLAACVAMTEAELDEATRLRDELRSGAAALFEQVDVVLMPVASTGPGLVRDPDRVTTDGQDGDLRAAVLPWTVPANLGGWPAVAVPVAVDADGLPIGLQIVGPPGGDARVLDVAEVLAAELAGREV